jgi:hypothetical protein
VNRPESALVALLFSVVIVAPAAAQQARPTPPPAVSDEFCSRCFAYLEFPPSLEPESYATRGEALETSTSLPAAEEPSGRLREQRRAWLPPPSSNRAPPLLALPHK